MKRRLLPDEIDQMPEDIRALAQGVIVEESRLEGGVRVKTLQMCFQQTFAETTNSARSDAEYAELLIRGVMYRVNEAQGTLERFKILFNTIQNTFAENKSLREENNRLKGVEA